MCNTKAQNLELYKLEIYDFNNKMFDFNSFDYSPGIYRLGTAVYIKNPPFADAGSAYSNVVIIQGANSDTQTRILFPWRGSRGICYRTGRRTDFATQPWHELQEKAII